MRGGGGDKKWEAYFTLNGFAKLTKSICILIITWRDTLNDVLRGPSIFTSLKFDFLKIFYMHYL